MLGAVVVMQVLAGAVGLSAAAVMVYGMWRESRMLVAATAAVSTVAVVGLLYMGGSLSGANEIVLSGLGG